MGTDVELLDDLEHVEHHVRRAAEAYDQTLLALGKAEDEAREAGLLDLERSMVTRRRALDHERALFAGIVRSIDRRISQLG